MQWCDTLGNEKTLGLAIEIFRQTGTNSRWYASGLGCVNEGPGISLVERAVSVEPWRRIILYQQRRIMFAV